MANQGELEPVTTDVLRQTQFMGKPLLVNNHIMTMSSIACRGDSPTAQAFAAFHPYIGSITARDGRRQELYLRLNKTSLVTKAYEKQLPPRGPSPPIDVRSEPPEYQPFSRLVVTEPAICPANDMLSNSGLLLTLPSSPAKPKGRFPNRQTRQSPAQRASYGPYQPAAATSAPILTSTEDASKRSLKPSRPNIAHKPYIGKPLPTPVLTVFALDTDYSLIEKGNPEPSLPQPATPLSGSSTARKFSFDFDSLPDWELIRGSPRTSTLPSNLRHTVPPPRDLTLRTSQTFLAESYIGLLPSPNLTTISPRTKTSLPESPGPELPSPSILVDAQLTRSPSPIDITAVETVDTQPRIPYPTTRFYGSAIWTYGGALSRRWTSKGTIKVGRYVECEGEQYEMTEMEPIWGLEAEKTEKEEWMVW